MITTEHDRSCSASDQTGAPDSIAARASAGSSLSSRSPASSSAPGPDKSTPVSVQELLDADQSASLILGGAPAAPRMKEDEPSHGTPISTGGMFNMLFEADRKRH